MAGTVSGDVSYKCLLEQGLFAIALYDSIAAR